MSDSSVLFESRVPPSEKREDRVEECKRVTGVFQREGIHTNRTGNKADEEADAEEEVDT